ncbi:EamA family transporter [Herbinix luporum]|jgi:drug/metabolite transporter (DMT)-like permease|uniref:Putative membrane protein n=1 Tax=Herbinix luporum TaxID=1679721 RepID=A0A0K8J389_9FIRM|nr:EamA family transporter [Herbinix luporum]MDI9488664.1 EamA family transporter [Bacillota bacterium]CUH92101.1 putative membrane protein [Herbinix luporum]HHT57516.1 EamA family transporter [Herbinix luporum]
MWFLFAVLTTLSWGTADLFYKKGSDSNDKYSHVKIGIMVGIVMGIHGVIYMLTKGISFDPFDMVKYLPVSFFYILSMLVGYWGLRYIELSISSPVQNSSGAITAIALILIFPQQLGALNILGIVLITGGVVGLAVLEKKLQTAALKAENVSVDPKYKIGVLAITFPILYAILDAIGTAADGIYLDELSLISEEAALLAYEFTWLLYAIFSLIYLIAIKKQKFNVLKEPVRASAAIFETAGQFFYVYAMSNNAVIAAPLIASYSIVSVILSRIFLKEKLSKQHYILIIIVMTGIAVLGLAEEL